MQPQQFSYFFLRKFISIKRASVLDGRFPGFNSLKGVLSLMKTLIPPPLEILPNLNGFAKPEICSKGIVLYIFSLTVRGHLFHVLLKKLAFPICFLLN